MADEFEETNVGAGRGEGVREAGRDGVSVIVGVITVSVEVDNTEVGEAGSVGVVDCGSNTFTWKEQALVNDKASSIKFRFMG